MKRPRSFGVVCLCSLGILLLLSQLVFFASCSREETVSKVYCDLPARFTYSPVSGISQLFSACNSSGQWCTITDNGTQFVFTYPPKSDGKPGDSTPVNRTAANSYTGFYMGLSGFILGLPNIPEPGEDFAVITCYDLACRNCYEDKHILSTLVLQTTGTATCSKCQRTYNLNNQGIISRGDPGKSLYRYRVGYANNTVTIKNP